MVIVKTEADIHIRLTGHFDARAKVSGVTFDPRVNPMIMKARFLTKLGTANLSPSQAAREQRTVGPIRKGTGTSEYHAMIAPSGPSQIEFAKSCIECRSSRLRFT